MAHTFTPSRWRVPGQLGLQGEILPQKYFFSCFPWVYKKDNKHFIGRQEERKDGRTWHVLFGGQPAWCYWLRTSCLLFSVYPGYLIPSYKPRWIFLSVLELVIFSSSFEPQPVLTATFVSSLSLYQRLVLTLPTESKRLPTSIVGLWDVDQDSNWSSVLHSLTRWYSGSSTLMSLESSGDVRLKMNGMSITGAGDEIPSGSPFSNKRGSGT